MKSYVNIYESECSSDRMFQDYIDSENSELIENDGDRYVKFVTVGKEDTYIDSILKFQVDRKLHEKPYVQSIEHSMILQEMLEAYGIHVEDNKEMLADYINKLVNKYPSTRGYEEVTKDEIVDSYADIIVFSIGAIMKLGYSPDLVLEEVGREINSRAGKFIDGKFIKDKSEKAMSDWYKACFENCKSEKN